MDIIESLLIHDAAKDNDAFSQISKLRAKVAELEAERDHWEQTCHAQWDNYQENIIPKLTAERDAALAENHVYYQLAHKEVWEAANKEITTLKSALRETNKILEDFKIAIQDYQSHYLHKRLYKPTIKAITTINEVLK